MSKTVSNNEENREKLASEIVEGWDLDSIIEFAVASLESRYEKDNNQFEKDWLEIFGEDEEEDININELREKLRSEWEHLVGETDENRTFTTWLRETKDDSESEFQSDVKELFRLANLEESEDK